MGCTKGYAEGISSVVGAGGTASVSLLLLPGKVTESVMTFKSTGRSCGMKREQRNSWTSGRLMPIKYICREIKSDD